jgi:peptide-methionine (R)-S-oxide reductase
MSSAGIYICTKCGSKLFEEEKRFEVRCGFPSFWLHLENNVRLRFLNTHGRERIQLICHQCGQHLGHLFSNAHTPSKLRYCVTHESITVIRKDRGLTSSSPAS